jgi:arsenate reductase (thioredoxin)
MGMPSFRVIVAGCLLTVAAGLLTTVPATANAADEASVPVQQTPVQLLPTVERYVAERIAEFDQIPAERKQELTRLGQQIRDRVADGKPVRLTFICTHNSRRSHLAQLWAAVAATHFKVDQIATYSGGTEVTAFNPRAVAAVQRAGMQVERSSPGNNPRYAVRFLVAGPPQVCFSKTFADVSNPASGFIAVMTCTDADERCPVVPNSLARVALPYEDPKVADDTPAESQRYDERQQQISREMLFLFAKAAENRNRE